MNASEAGRPPRTAENSVSRQAISESSYLHAVSSATYIPDRHLLLFRRVAAAFTAMGAVVRLLTDPKDFVQFFSNIAWVTIPVTLQVEVLLSSRVLGSSQQLHPYATIDSLISMHQILHVITQTIQWPVSLVYWLLLPPLSEATSTFERMTLGLMHSLNLAISLGDLFLSQTPLTDGAVAPFIFTLIYILWTWFNHYFLLWDWPYPFMEEWLDVRASLPTAGFGIFILALLCLILAYWLRFLHSLRRSAYQEVPSS
ncbi:hypothetical protein DFS34DRAFT_627216 [Phlyctochytrium arcticum]|nr:hypothetical protein DFS34DRAFT_627216 [Phlyctochytrium arcticum]